MLKSILSALLLFPTIAGASPLGLWVADADIDLVKVPTSTELASIVGSLTTQAFISGRDFSCSYQSKIVKSYLEEGQISFLLGFEVSGDPKHCGSGEAVFQELWTDISNTPNLSLGSLRKLP